MKTKEIFTFHLLLPFLSFFLAFIVAMINKKNAVTSLKELLVFFLISSFIVGASGILGLLDPNFLPLIYIYVQVFFLGIGYIYMQKLSIYFTTSEKRYDKIMMILYTAAVLFLGSYIFSLLFNICGKFDYGLMASTCTYTLAIPLFFKWAYQALLDIPASIFKMWKFNAHYKEPDFTSETSEKIMVLELELSKKPEDIDFIKVKAKAPASFAFGEWFHMFLTNYNAKYHDSPIQYKASEHHMYNWIFYVKPSLSIGKRFIDHEKSIDENRIDERYTIICKRVDITTY